MIRFSVAALLVVATLPSFAVTKETASNSQALSYAAQSIASLTGGNSINDVTLTGTVTWTAGSDTETGTATLSALGTGESRMDLALSTGTRTDIRDSSTGTPLGKWITQGNASGMFAFHNCQTDAVWFFPALGSLVGGANVVFSYVGLETRNSMNVQHIQSYMYQSISSASSKPSLQTLSTMDFYLDATTLLPSAITFNAHPDNNAGANISVEVDFSNYQAVEGITVPMHIQKYVQGTLTIDLTVSSAVFNTGLSLSTFAVH